MKKGTIIDPPSRLSGISTTVDESTGFVNQVVGIVTYHCPICDDRNGLSVLAGEINSISLPEEIFQLFNNTYPMEETQVYLDFMCRTCKSPARIVFSRYEFHMASYYYYADAVIELDRDAS